MGVGLGKRGGIRGLGAIYAVSKAKILRDSKEILHFKVTLRSF